MRKLKDAIRRFFGFWDSYGLKYSIAHYELIQDDIMTYCLKKQSRYANRATVVYVHDIKFLHKAFLPFSEKPDKFIFQNFNAISVGNLAYIQRYAKTAHFRNKAKSLLARYNNYLLNISKQKQLIN